MNCKCGCGLALVRRRVFVNKEHQLRWMKGGGASEMNKPQSLEAKQRGGHTAGYAAQESGRLAEAAKLGGQRSREIAEEFRQQ